MTNSKTLTVLSHLKSLDLAGVVDSDLGMLSEDDLRELSTCLWEQRVIAAGFDPETVTARQEATMRDEFAALQAAIDRAADARERDAMTDSQTLAVSSINFGSPWRVGDVAIYVAGPPHRRSDIGSTVIVEHIGKNMNGRPVATIRFADGYRTAVRACSAHTNIRPVAN